MFKFSNAKRWYVGSNIHREDGPAVEYDSGAVDWWLNGKYYYELNDWLKDNHTLTDEEKVMIKLQYG
jgi:hypothetical protein